MHCHYRKNSPTVSRWNFHQITCYSYRSNCGNDDANHSDNYHNCAKCSRSAETLARISEIQKKSYTGKSETECGAESRSARIWILKRQIARIRNL